MNRRETLVSVLGAGLLALAGVLPAAATEQVVFQLDWLPGGDKSPVYLAVQKGLFAAEGIEVTIVSGRGSSDAITKIATGAADMGTGGLGALMTAKAQGEVPVKAVMSIYTDQPDAIFAVAGSGIATIKDVAGKTVATAPFSSSNVTWPLVLAANGVDPEKVKLLKVDPGALAPMLATGQVDATINWVTVAPGSTGVLKEAGKELVVLPWSNFGFEGYGLSMFASDKMLAERPLTVGKVVKVMQQAMAMAAAEPLAAGEALKAKVPEVDAAVAAAEFAASVPLIFNAVTEKHGIGAFDKARLATTWEWVAKSQNYPLDKLDPETLVDRGFVGG